MPPPFLVDLPLLPESAVGHALQFIDLLRVANLMAGLRLGPQAPRFAWRFTDGSGTALPPEQGLLRTVQREGQASGPASALFLAPLHCADIPAVRAAARRHAATSAWVGRAVDQGATVCTQGNSAWLAGYSGRLAHHRVALPWFYIAGFGQDFPDIAVASEGEWCEDGPWISTSASGALATVAVRLAHRAWGAELAASVQAVLQPDPARIPAAVHARNARRIPATRDGALARAIAWLEQHVDQPYDLEALARAAAVSPRTLLRHFRQELGHSPLDHLHRLRCARARVLLEITLESIPTVAQSCGYADPAAFRRIFARHTGMAPAEYRRRHTLRAPRRRWRVDLASAAPAADAP